MMWEPMSMISRRVKIRHLRDDNHKHFTVCGESIRFMIPSEYVRDVGSFNSLHESERCPECEAKAIK